MTRPLVPMDDAARRGGGERRRAAWVSVSLVLAVAGVLLAPSGDARLVALVLSTGALLAGTSALRAASRSGSERTSARIAVVLAIVGMLFAGALSMFGTTSAGVDRPAGSGALTSPTDAAPSPNPASTAGESAEHGVGEFEAGTYSVGQDIAPGRYRTEGGPGCGWAQYVLGGDVLVDTGASGSAAAPSSMVISPAAESVELRGNCIWAPD